MSIQVRRPGRTPTIGAAPAINGYRKSYDTTKIAIQFGTELFATIEKRANQCGTSFAEQVRLLCKIGLSHE